MPRNYPPSTLSSLFGRDGDLQEGQRVPRRVSELDLSARGRSSRWLQRNAMLLGGLCAVLVAVLALALVVTQPWLGVRLQAQGGELRVLRVEAGSPAEAAGVLPGTRLLALSALNGGGTMTLEPDDLIRNPDLFPDYATWGRFYERQSRLAQWLRSGPVVLHVQDALSASPRQLVLLAAERRPVVTMRLAFWFQMLVQLAGLMAAGWVLAVHRMDSSTCWVALAGLAMSAAVGGAAVISARELVLPAGLMHGLLEINHVATAVAVLSLAGVLSVFPLTLRGARRSHVFVVFGFFMLWALADAQWWLPSPNWGSRTMLLCAVVLVFVQAMRQWRATADRPKSRIAVRALAVPWMLGLSCLFGLREGILLLGGAPPIPQAWLFGTIMIAAIAAIAGVLGLRYMRAFDLDDWALQALLSWGAGLGTLVCYRVLTVSLGINGDLAVLLAVLLFGIVYVPLSSGVWKRSILRRGPTPSDLTSAILALGLTMTGERTRQWTTLLTHTFRARRFNVDKRPPEAMGTSRSMVVAGGRALWVAPVAGLPGVTLWYCDRGARRFKRADRRLAQRLSALAARVIQARQAYVRGAADERERIADDLHDDLGAKLLSLMHASTRLGANTEVTRLAREALQEMRLSVRHLKAQPTSLADVLGEWRAETVARLDAAGIGLNWDAQLPPVAPRLSAHTSAQLTRVLREAVSNILRHSGGSQCRVLLQVTPADLHLEVEDNGKGMDPVAARARAGQGLASIERRVRRLGGAHRYTTGTLGGTLLMVRVPLA